MPGFGDLFSYGLLCTLVLAPLAWMASSRVRYVVFMASFYFCIFFTAFLAFFVVVWHPYRPDNHVYVLSVCLHVHACRWVFRIMRALTASWVRVKSEVRNKRLLDEIDGPCIIVANHQSSIDLIGVCARARRAQTRSQACCRRGRKTVSRWPRSHCSTVASLEYRPH